MDPTFKPWDEMTDDERTEALYRGLKDASLAGSIGRARVKWVLQSLGAIRPEPIVETVVLWGRPARVYAQAVQRNYGAGLRGSCLRNLRGVCVMTDDLHKRDAVKRFIDQYESGAQGCHMDADDAQAFAEILAALLARLEDANASVVAFCAPVAVEYARGMGLSDGHLHPTHYDILEKAGARMDRFTRADLAQIEEREE